MNKDQLVIKRLLVQSQLRKALKSRGFTITEVSQKTGMERASLSRILSGRTNPSLESLISICEVIGVKSLLMQ